ncbi:MAG: hypothetical protein PHQ02_07790 [Candidatus Riflebacteria bacterium]|nr:hypothetical protein [Candidatus Riflebacteria bacterium]
MKPVFYEIAYMQVINEVETLENIPKSSWRLITCYSINVDAYFC